VSESISFCLSHYNRPDRLSDIIAQLEVFGERIVVTNFIHGGIGRPHVADENVKVMNVRRRFSRSSGLNQAAACSSSSILCFLDVDMVVPADFAETIKSLVRPGSCYFPICFSLYKNCPTKVSHNNGYWRKHGFGNCAFTSEDFELLGCWDESFIKWGGEDTDLFNRATAELIVHRQRCNGLFHRWHPKEPW
jgi:hypothetical protein